MTPSPSVKETPDYPLVAAVIRAGRSVHNGCRQKPGHVHYPGFAGSVAGAVVSVVRQAGQAVVAALDDGLRDAWQVGSGLSRHPSSIRAGMVAAKQAGCCASRASGNQEMNPTRFPGGLSWLGLLCHAVAVRSREEGCQRQHDQCGQAQRAAAAGA